MASTASNRSNTINPEAVAWLFKELEQVLIQTQKTLRSRLRVFAGERASTGHTEESVLQGLQNKLEQSTKAFAMLDVPGAIELLSGITKATAYLTSYPQAFTKESVDTIERACFALLDYLEQIQIGKEVTPVALFSQYYKVAELTQREVLPAELWGYEFSWKDIKLPQNTHSHTEQQNAYSRLNSFMLSLLRGKLEAAIDFKVISLTLAETAQAQLFKQFWSLVAGFFDGIASGAIELNIHTKRAASHLIKMYEAYTKNQLKISDDFAKTLLFFCANTIVSEQRNKAEILNAVIKAYGVEDFQYIDYARPVYGRVDPALIKQTRAAITTAKATWSSFSSGEPIAVNRVSAAVVDMCKLLIQTIPESKKFAETLVTEVNKLVQAAKAPPPSLALEVATAILYLDAVFDSLDLNNETLKDKFARLVERLTSAAQEDQALPIDPWIEELYQNIHDQASMGNVVTELHAMVNKVEQQIDNFLRKNADPIVLTEAISGMRQIFGVLSVLGVNDASRAVTGMIKKVEWLVHNHADQSEDKKEERKAIIFSLSNSLGAFGFLVNMLGYQPLIARELFSYDESKQELIFRFGRVHEQKASLTKLPEPDKVTDQNNEENLDDDISKPIADNDLLNVDTRTLVGTLDDQLTDTIESDHLEDDLRSIFLEEAREVIATGREELEKLSQARSDIDELRNVRRAFHTLKGSARMVGLMNYSEAAWSIEQCFNEWLASGITVSDELIQLAFWSLKTLEEVSTQLQSGIEAYAKIEEFQSRAQAALPPVDKIPVIDDEIVSISDETTEVSNSAATLILDTKKEVAQKAAAEQYDFSNIDLSLTKTDEWTDTIQSPPVNDQETGLTESFNLDSEPSLLSNLATEDVPSLENVHVNGLDEINRTQAEIIDSAELQDNDFDHSGFEPTKMLSEKADQIQIDTQNDEALELIDEAVSIEKNIKNDVIEIGGLQVDSNLYEIYVDESQTRIEQLKAALLQWQSAGNFDALNSARIAAHTISGNSSTIGFVELAQFAKKLELAIDYYKKTLSQTQIPTDRSNAALFWESAEEIERLSKQFINKNYAIANQELLATLIAFAPNQFLTSGCDHDEQDWGPDEDQELDVDFSDDDIDILDIPDSELPNNEDFHLDDDEVDIDLEDSDFTESVTLDVDSSIDSVYPGVTTQSQEIIRGLSTDDEVDDLAEQLEISDDDNDIVYDNEEDSELDLIDTLSEEELLVQENDAESDQELVVPNYATSEALDTFKQKLLAQSQEPAVATLTQTGHSHPNKAQLAIYDVDLTDQEALTSEVFIIFKEEATDLLDQIGKGFRIWMEHQGEQPLSKEVSRALHTLKGSARLAGAMRLGSLTHELESLLKNITTQEQFETTIGKTEDALLQVEAEFDLLCRAAKEVEAGIITVPAVLAAVDHSEDDNDIEAIRGETTSKHEEAFEALDAIDQVIVGSDIFVSFIAEAQRKIKDIKEHLAQWQQKPDSGIALVNVLRALNVLRDNIKLAGLSRIDRIVQKLDAELRTLIGVNPTSQQIEQVISLFSSMSFEYDLLSNAALKVQEDNAHLIEQVDNEIDTPSDVLSEQDDILESSQTYDDVQSQLLSPQDGVKTEDTQLTPRSINPTATRTVTTSPTKQMLRIHASLIDQLVTKSGEVNMIRGQLAGEMRSLKDVLMSELTLNLDRLREQLRDIEIQAETQMTSRMDAARAEGHEFDPLEFDRFTRIQELTRIMAESVNDVGTVQKAMIELTAKVEDGLAAQARSAKDMQHTLLRARMVSFSSVTERFHRTIRLTAKESQKDARLLIEGGEIEIDRAVLDYVAPAFEHMLRNSIVHGIESPKERQKLGKNVAGTVKISLAQEGNDVLISLSDDGQGFDLEKIRKKAQNLGLIQPGSDISDYDLAQMIYKSGLTTADEVTELAGRGVGLDMAYAEIIGLGGRIEVITERHKGTEFRVTLPLTTAVTQVAVVKVADKTFGIPVSLIESIQRFSSEEVMEAVRTGKIPFQGEMLPAYWMGGLLEIQTERTNVYDHKLQWLVLRSAGQRIIVAVDQVVGSQEVVIKNVGPQFAHLAGFSGLTMLSGGRTVFIYNPAVLARVYGEHGKLSDIFILEKESSFQISTTQHDHLSATGALHTRKVMVVDDSLTVRRVTERFLEKAGYDVILAKDGRDALEQIDNEIPALVLSDIEMPRMDGFELVRQLRTRRETENIPVIMITSRIAQKHHDYAKELGVNHYLGKPYDEERLLQLVKNYVPDYKI